MRRIAQPIEILLGALPRQEQLFVAKIVAEAPSYPDHSII